MSLNAPVVIDVSEVPKRVIDQLSEPFQVLKAARFELILATKKQELGMSEGYALQMLSSDGLMTGSLISARLSRGAEVNETIAVSIVSRRRQGQTIATSNSGFGLKSPPGVSVSRIPGAGADEILRNHLERIARVLDLVPFDRRTLDMAIDAARQKMAEFNLRRGFYVFATQDEIDRAAGESVGAK